jgi:hypothetical protein
MSISTYMYLHVVSTDAEMRFETWRGNLQMGDGLGLVGVRVDVGNQKVRCLVSDKSRTSEAKICIMCSKLFRV